MFFPSNPKLARKEQALKRLMRKADSAMQEASFLHDEKAWDKASLRYLNAVDAYNAFYREHFSILYK